MLLLATIAQAQETRGSIQGRVHDSSGAVVTAATVTVTNLATNVSVAATTNEEGLYQALFLLPGMYKLSAAATGFKTAVRDNIQLQIHERLQVDFQLEVGAVSEQVEVTAEAPLLQVATANTGLVLGAQAVANLPIPHGSPYTLLFFAPGTITARATNRLYQETSNLDQLGNEITFNGQPAGTSEFTIDGSPNVQSSKSAGPMNSPPADLVQEVKLESAFDASVGHSSGTVVNVSLKTGGNQPHGTAAGFFRDPDWDANTFFSNASGQPKTPYRNKRWSATLSGPVKIPKLYDGKDRTFFTYGYEGVRRTESNPTVDTVPTPAQLKGDFSGLLALGSQYQIYDPSTTIPAANGRFSRQPFAGNIVPQGRFSPIAVKAATHFTQANAQGTADGVNNFVKAATLDTDDYFNHTARIDHNISERQRIYGRFSAMRRIAFPFRYYDDPSTGTVDISQGQPFTGQSKQAALDDVYTLGPRTVINARYAYSRFLGVWGGLERQFDPATLGFSPAVTSLLTRRGSYFPGFSVAGVMGLGTNGRYETVVTDIHSLSVNLNHQRASHGLKFGADLRANRGIDNPVQYARGRFNFDTTYTRGPLDNSSSSPGSLGQGLAAFLLGVTSSGYIDDNASMADQSTYFAFYAHDNWRVRPKLTVDLGLRWEYEGPMTERFNRAVNGFDPNASQSIAAAAQAAYAAKPDASLPPSQFQVRGGLLFAGGSRDRGMWNRNRGVFSPRIGFSYQATEKTVVRGGFGVYPIEIGQVAGTKAIQSGFSQRTNLIPTQDSGVTFVANLANPFPDGLLAPTGSSLGAATFLGQGISFYDPNAPQSYAMNWNVNVQRVLPGQVLVEAGYLADKAIKLRINDAVNALPNQYLSTSPFRDQTTINYLTQNVTNPFQGLLPGTSYNGTTISRSQLLSPYPAFGGITMTTSQGYSWFHALQLRVERRMSRGFTIQAAYMFSKKMEATSYLNSGDPTPYRSISSIDRPHTFTLTSLYELPFGRGKALAGNIGKVPNLLIGGWELGASWQDQSGTPIGFGNVLFLGNLKDLPLSSSERTLNHWFNIDAGFNRTSSQQLANNLRAFPLRLSGLRTSTYNVADLSVLKNFIVTERHRFQFRLEAFNFLNHPTSFDAPNTSPTSSAFGTVTGQSALPRQVMLGVKYLF